MRSLTLAQIADLTKGSAEGTGLVNQVTIDSRLATSGSLFVALPGEKVDGHQFVADVLAKGGYGLVKKGSFTGPGVVQVEDPLVALQTLATEYLIRYPVPVVAVTGSNGKTSTKDMIAQVLRSRHCVHSTHGNHNNELGVPLTVLGLNEQHEILVAEMGMRGLGQIKRLTEICPPNVGVITNIGPVHLELLGSMGNIAQAKGELLDGLGPDGIAVLNGDDPSVRGQARSFKVKVVFFGLDEANQVVARGVMMGPEGNPSFAVRHDQDEVKVRLAVPGLHNVWNACAALTVGLQYGVSLEEGAKALEALSSSAMRLEIQRNSQGVIIVNDSYNASPASMKGALDTLAHMYCSGKRVAILGDILELGDISEQAHREVGQHAQECAEQLVFIGQNASFMQEGAGRGEVYSSVEEFLLTDLKYDEGDLVLVKASRGLHFERIVEHLMKGGE